jgi:hypothetical protein
MPLSRLQLLPYLQEWDGTRLRVRLLAAPQGSPVDPLLAGAPSFASAAFTFEVRLVDGLGAIPTLGSAFHAFPVAVPTPPQAAALFNGLAATLPVDTTIPPVDPRRAGLQFLKYTPPGYRDATGYTDGRNPFLVTDDRYHCALKSETPAGTVIKSEVPKLPWGKVLALALRQPLLAEALGLVRRLEVEPDAGFFDHGGWVYVSLAAGSDAGGLLGIPDALKSYAARVPGLSAPRSLFTSVLFPVASVPPAASYDALFREAVDYDDGFAKAVYARQATQLDPLAEQADGSRPANDHGVQLGWDDEQVATWLNRQTDPAAAIQDAPTGVLGYRVDARVVGDAAWHSLVMGSTSVVVNGIDLGSHTGEFRVEIAPNKLMGETTDTFWIPIYYTAWTGPSLVARDRVAARLHGIDAPTVVEGVDPTVLLRYGQSYEFRVRLTDHTGGGPAPGEAPANPAPQPLAPLRFRRWVRPQSVRIDTSLPVVPDPLNPPVNVVLRRPRLVYPAYVMAGGAAADLLADLPQAIADKRGVGLPDPDVTAVEIVVQVASPAATDGFVTLYQTTRPFPAGPDDPLTLAFDWQDVHDATTLVAPPNGPIPLPTSRLVRISVNAVAATKPDYFGDDDVRHGPATQLAARKESADERGLLLVASVEAIEGIFLQPEAAVDSWVALAQKAAGKALAAPDNALGRLAVALDLDVYGVVGLRARPGHRILFGCAPGLRHSLGPDGGSVQFGSLGDLTGAWLIPVRLELSRDWSWDGLDHLSIQRDGVEVGQVEPRRTVGYEATAGAPHDRSEFLFIDSFDPKPPAGQFPSEPLFHYKVVPVFRHAPAQVDAVHEFDLHLPITTPPSQVPRLVSAGLALSPYQRDPAYSQTDVRQKMIWLEFEAPPDNPADSYFARTLAQAPDPVLTRGTPEIAESAEPPLPIDPDPIRTIVPGQSDDQAGLSAMQVLLPTDSPRHFLVRLPGGLTPESPAMFGFFTYELRIGHAMGWSTAQGRFGRPLRVTGVQHPMPTLLCAVVRDRRGIEVSAPFADPTFEGQSLRPFPPVTQLWVLLYAQVHQADGADMRNVLLGHRQAVPQPQRWERKFDRLRVDAGTATWSNAEVEQLLELLALGSETPLSCLAVETLPGDQPIHDPVGEGLGYERFLRTSPLTPIPDVCL